MLCIALQCVTTMKPVTVEKLGEAAEPRTFSPVNDGIPSGMPFFALGGKQIILREDKLFNWFLNFWIVYVM